MLSAFVIFFHLGDRDMWNGLESESAIAGWDMVESGRILVPHILDRPFTDNRPPGAWWLITAAYKRTGLRNTWTARLPSALAALVCILLVCAIGMLRAGRRRTAWKTAWISCIIAPAFFMGDIYARAGITLLSQKFAEKVAQAVPDNGRLGTLDDHEGLLFHR